MILLGTGSVYLLIGLSCIFWGSVSRRINLELLKVRYITTSSSKRIMFKTLLITSVILLWPFLLLAAIKDERKQKEKFKSLHDFWANGTDQNLFSTAERLQSSGNFAYSPNNPIPVRGHLGALEYLSKLSFSDGKKILFDRIGSYESEATVFPVDGYSIQHPMGTVPTVVLYLSPYHELNSTELPQGFNIFPDSKTSKHAVASEHSIGVCNAKRSPSVEIIPKWIEPIKLRANKNGAEHCSNPHIAITKQATTNSRTEVYPTWDKSDVENQRLQKKGYRTGLACITNAKKIIASRTDDFIIWQELEEINVEARILADNSGFLERGEEYGMEDEVDGSDPSFDERRAAFISGLEDALDKGYQVDDE